MKVLVEANFFLEKEPADFENIEVQKRKVYTWGSNRLQFSENSPYTVYSRATELTETPVNPDTNITEVWYLNKESPPTPPNPDDAWTEVYKEIPSETILLEWHTNHNQLRVSWNQTIKTLQQGKILANVQKELQRFGLGLGELPQLDSSLIEY
jgi:hypothetical protein